MTTTTTAAAIRNLSTCILHWPDLVDALGARSTPTWPPAGRMNDHLRALDQADDELEALHAQTLTTVRTPEGRISGYRCTHCGDVDPGHAHPAGEDRDPAQIGKRPIPIRLPIHETMRIVRGLLLDCADATAESVQRRPIAPPAPRHAAYARTRAERLAWDDHARRVQAAQDDAADPRRWRWTGIRPDAPYTALWLLGRAQGAPGPFRPLGETETKRIAGVAHTAARHVEQALDVGERTAALAIPCPTCGGQVSLHGGAGASPVAHCTGCGRIWTEGGVIAA